MRMAVHVVFMTVGLRLRWWSRVTMQAFARHWQWFVLAGVLVPRGTPLGRILDFLAAPLLRLVMPGQSFGNYAVLLLMCAALASLWVLSQFKALEGGAFSSYLFTLPMSAVQQLAVNALVILPADAILLVPIAAFLLRLPAAHGHASGVMAVEVLCLLALLGMMQIAILARRKDLWVLQFLALWVLAVALACNSVSLFVVVALGGVVFSFYQICHMPSGVWSVVIGRYHNAWVMCQSNLIAYLPPAARIQWRALGADQALWGRLLTILVILVAADTLLIAFDFNDRSVAVLIVASAALALVVAGWFRALNRRHAAARAWLNTLPLRAQFWPMKDTALLCLIGAVCALPMMGAVCLHDAVASSAAAVILLAYLLLIALLRIVVVHAGRQTTLCSVLLVAGWGALLFYALH